MRAWLETLSDDMVETIRASPRDTITPGRDHEGARALALLRELASAGATTSLKIRGGEVIGEGGMGIVRAAEQVALVGFLGVIFTATPLVLALMPGVFAYTYRTHALFSGISSLVVAAIVWWARASLTATVVNRRVAAAAIYMLAGQAILALGLGEVGASIVMVQLATQFLWVTAAAWFALTLDPWFAPSVATFLAAFAIAALWPATQLFVTAASNLAFAINLIVRWRPDTWSRSIHPVADEAGQEAARAGTAERVARR